MTNLLLPFLNPLRKPPRLPIFRRSLSVESLETRRLLASVPFGALQDDTGEYFLGKVVATVVLMESTGVVDPNLEDWNSSLISQAKAKVRQSLDWWEEALALENSVHSLNITYDFTYANNPVPTPYEPISRRSNDFVLWVDDFLHQVGYNSQADFHTDIRAFNNAQRIAHGANWAFTVFVINDQNDLDGKFAVGGSFRQAFAYGGGRFFVSPAGRPASTFAHETGHIFWAKDEYLGGQSYLERRGYYDAQNWNARDQQTSIMLDHEQAFANHQISNSAKEMIGWRDSDGDGIFDVLDTPHKLEGVGYYDAAQQVYHFQGHSQVTTTPNLNSSGLQNDITINEISRAEYRIDGGNWRTIAAYHDYQAALDVMIPAATGFQQIEIRTIDAQTGVSSPVFVGGPDRLASTLTPGLNGFVWNDADGDGQWQAGEQGLSGWTVRLVDENRIPISLEDGVEPDDYLQGAELNTVNPQVSLRAVGGEILDDVVTARERPQTSTGSKVFHHLIPTIGWSSAWTSNDRKLRMDFTNPVTSVRLDAVANSHGDYGRLEIYDANDQLLARYTTGPLQQGEVETMALHRPTADIAYAIARGHLGTAVQFDNLRFGPQAQAVTDDYGAWSIGWLEGGEYSAEIAAPPIWQVTTQDVYAMQLPSGGAIGNLDFGLSFDTSARPLHNAPFPEDVNGDGILNNKDAMEAIGFLRDHEGGARVEDLPPPIGGPWKKLDVNGDNAITTIDGLLVISALRDQQPQSNFATSGGGQDHENEDSEGEVERENRRQRRPSNRLRLQPTQSASDLSSDYHHATSIIFSDYGQSRHDDEDQELLALEARRLSRFK